MKKTSVLRSEKGLATLETLPILVVFLLLTGYSFGMFGIVQSAILNSIGARVYAFETFRNRANVTYFRSNRVPANKQDQTVYHVIGNRQHRVVSEIQSPATLFPTTTRPLAMGLSNVTVDEGANDLGLHNDKLPPMLNQERYSQGVAPVWLKIGYGICLNAKCGS